MYKKTVSLLLALSMLLCLGACSKKGGSEETSTGFANTVVKPMSSDISDVEMGDKKVCIMVAPESQYPEDYLTAQAIAGKYPDNVFVREYADSRILVGGDSEIITASREVAKDKKVGAIIYARATQFTRYASLAAKEVNPSILTVAIEPESSINEVSSDVDLVLCALWKSYAKDIVGAAKAHGAEYFVFFSVKRQADENALYQQLRSSIESECNSQKITFINKTGPDPDFYGNDGIEAARKEIKQMVSDMKDAGEIKGENVVLFSTESAAQKALVEMVAESNYIYVCPSFPTAYNGIGEAFEISVPDDITDFDTYLENVKSALKDKEGRYSLYCNSLTGVLQLAAVCTAFDMMNDKLTGDNAMADLATSRLSSLAGDSGKVEMSMFSENAICLYIPGFETVK